MIKKRYLISVIIFSIFIFTLSLQAGEITGDDITVNTLDQEQEIYEVIAEGDVRVERDDLVLWGDYVHYYNDSEDISLAGNVRVEEEDYLITGDELSGNLGGKEFTITGQGRVTGPDEFLLLASTIVYDHSSGLMIAEGEPEFNYQQITATADKITYDREQELVILSGNVEGRRGQREFAARGLTVDLTTDEINLSGKARLSFPEEND